MALTLPWIILFVMIYSLCWCRKFKVFLYLPDQLLPGLLHKQLRLNIHKKILCTHFKGTNFSQNYVFWQGLSFYLIGELSLNWSRGQFSVVVTTSVYMLSPCHEIYVKGLLQSASLPHWPTPVTISLPGGQHLVHPHNICCLDALTFDSKLNLS